jgi:hypothetical protein
MFSSLIPDYLNHISAKADKEVKYGKLKTIRNLGEKPKDLHIKTSYFIINYIIFC